MSCTYSLLRTHNSKPLAACLFFFFLLVSDLLVTLLRRLLLGFSRSLRLLHFQFAAEQFDNGEIGAVTLAVAKFDDSAVTAFAIGKLGSDGVEDLFGDGFLHDIGLHKPPRMETV